MVLLLAARRVFMGQSSMLFQKDGKTPSYTVELNSKGEKIRSVFFDLDGKTPLYENNYNK